MKYWGLFLLILSILCISCGPEAPEIDEPALMAIVEELEIPEELVQIKEPELLTQIIQTAVSSPSVSVIRAADLQSLAGIVQVEELLSVFQVAEPELVAQIVQVLEHEPPAPIHVLKSEPSSTPSVPPSAQTIQIAEPEPSVPVIKVEASVAATREEPVKKTPEPPSHDLFEHGIVTKEEYEATKVDIQGFVEDLNRIIRARNYTTWLTHLSDGYRTRITSREFINDLVTRYPVFRGKINGPRDYFTNVIVPSRANDQVDDIEFITTAHVKAYTVDKNGNRLILYDLQNIDNKWLIVQ